MEIIYRQTVEIGKGNIIEDKNFKGLEKFKI